MWRDREKIEVIAATIGISAATVCKKARGLGLPRRDGKAWGQVGGDTRAAIPILSENKAARAKRLWAKRMWDTAQIATILGASEAAVYNTLANRRGSK